MIPMPEIKTFTFSIEKAEYLLNFKSHPGKGGDKSKFWREIMGFQQPALLRKTILDKISAQLLQFQDDNGFGDVYRAIISLVDPAGRERLIRTVWIVLYNENVARFVTAYPA